MSMEQLPKFSFSLPVYDASCYLQECLESIFSQDYPQGKIEVLLVDGGSTDNTLEIAKRFPVRIFKNPKRLAEYGVQLGVRKATGDFLVIFAADNELVGNDWVQKVVSVFNNVEDISAVWGKLVSGENDSVLNKYFELIQSDPLNWFLNNNLNKYKSKAQICGRDCLKFRVNPTKPLVWGANGLVYRTEKIKTIWAQSGYLGDNDAFQYMVEQDNNKVAYFTSSFVYHHHVAKLGDFMTKWKRNFIQHLLNKQKTRNINWIFVDNFKTKLFFWIMYSAIPIFSFSHSVYLCLKDRNIHWFYHPVVSFLQFFTYSTLTLFTKKGRNFVKGVIFSTAEKVM